MKTIYYIGMKWDRLVRGEVAVTKETDKMYYINPHERIGALGWCTQFRKSDEGEKWTTHESKFKEIAQRFCNEELRKAQREVSNAQFHLETLKTDIKALGFEVEE